MNSALTKTLSLVASLLVVLLGLTTASCTDCTKPDPENQDRCEDSVLYFGDDSDTPSAGGSANAGGSSNTADGVSGSSGGVGGTTDVGGSAGGASDSTSTTGAGGSGPVTVWTWGETGNEDGLDDGAWVADSTLGSSEGLTALHPPAFNAGDEFEFELTCGGKAHTQLRFFMYEPSESRVIVELQVEGEPEPRVLPTYTGWDEQVINVEPGPHTYVFRASSAEDSSPRVLLDSFRCLDAEVVPAINGEVDMEDGFIPVEITGEWQVDNLQGVQDGDAAIHPPAFDAGDEFEFELTCDGDDHTQLRFFMYEPSESRVIVELQVEGEPEPRVLPTYTGWDEQVINVEPGPHTYVFRASSTEDSSPRVLLDSFRCLSAEVEPATNGEVDMDDGFIPVEITGEWQVDGLQGVQDGDAAIHPPAFDAGDEFEFELTCDGDDHTQLRFFMYEPSESRVIVELQVEGEPEPRVLPTYTGWDEQRIDVEPGPHTYLFRAVSDEASPPRVILDSFVCGTD